MEQSGNMSRISKAGILIPNIMLVRISNIMTNEMQEKLNSVRSGDVFEINGLGTLKVRSTHIENDFEKERQFEGFHFWKFLYTCEFI